MRDQAAELRRIVHHRNQERHTALKEGRAGRQQFIAVASGKGGVGKTSFSVNLAVAMQRKDQRVLIMDADLGLSNVNVLLGEMPPYNLHHVLRGERTLKETVFETRVGVDIISGASGLKELANLSGEERFSFIEQIEWLDPYDVVVVDTGAGISDNVISFLLPADSVIILATPEPTSITDAYGIIKVLLLENPEIIVDLVINQCKNLSEGHQVADRIIDSARHYLGAEVKYLGSICHDEAVTKALYRRRPFVLESPRAKSSVSVDAISRRLLDLPESKARPPGLFRKWLVSILN